MVQAQVFKYVKVFEGAPQEDNFQLVTEELPPIQNGEFLAEALFLSVDPYMRMYNSHPLGTTFLGEQVARIVESKNPKFPVGKLVVGSFGWRTHSISDGTGKKNSQAYKPYLLPDIGDLSPSLGIGTLGMPGNTAYLGFYKLQQPKKGETLVVSGAAGAVGNVVGQIGKLSGLTVIAIAGSEEKGKWLTEELGFDHFINYKTADVAKELARIAPKGVDIYYDNVGGDISTAVLQNMKTGGRITVCGIVSQYNSDELSFGYKAVLVLAKELTVNGYVIWNHYDDWIDAIRHVSKWIKAGDIKCNGTVTNGFKNMPKAFIGMLRGENKGKAIVKV